MNEAQLILAEREAKILELDEAYQTALADADQLSKLAETDEELRKTQDDLRAEERLNQQQADDFAMQLKQQKEEFQSMVDNRDMDYAALENHNDNLKEEMKNVKDDLQKLQNALRDQADQSQRLGQSHVHDKYALELEIDRLKRQVASLERELEAAAKSVERKEDLIKERDAAFIKAVSHAADRAYVHTLTVGD